MSTLKVAGLEEPLMIDFIVWIEGNSNYARFHFENTKDYLLSQTLKWLEERLPTFVRIHKSALINPAHVVHFEQFKAKEAYVVMSNGHRIQLAYRRIDEVRAKLRMVAFNAQSFQLPASNYITKKDLLVKNS